MAGEVLVYALVQVAAGPGWWWWRQYGRAAVRGGLGGGSGGAGNRQHTSGNASGRGGEPQPDLTWPFGISNGSFGRTNGPGKEKPAEDGVPIDSAGLTIKRPTRQSRYRVKGWDATP